MSTDINNNKEEIDSSPKKTSPVIGCLIVSIILGVIITIFILMLPDDDVYQYKEEYSYEETEKFEQKRDSIAFVTFKEDVKKLAKDWSNNSIPKVSISDPAILKESVLFIETDYPDTSLIDFFIETKSFTHINKGDYAMYLTLQEALPDEIRPIEDLSLNAFKYTFYHQVEFSEKNAIERASGMPYFFLVEDVLEFVGEMGEKRMSKTEKKVFVYDRYNHTIVLELQVNHSEDANYILKDDLRKKISAL